MAPGIEVPRSDERRRVLVDVDDGLRRVRDGEGRRLREPHELDADVDGEHADQHGQQRGDDDHRREGEALARGRERLRDREHGLGRHRRVAPLAPPLADHVLGIEPEVERVVAQEALGVDGARQLRVVAVLERGEVAGPDLRVALGAVEVDALALARGDEALGQARDRPPWRSARSASRPPRRPPHARLVPSCLVLVAAVGPGPSSRRRTTRAFDPSNAPMYPRASSWSMIRAARA